MCQHLKYFYCYRGFIYNELCPHFSNHYLTPKQMHNQSVIKMKTYKNKSRSKSFCSGLIIYFCPKICIVFSGLVINFRSRNK